MENRFAECVPHFTLVGEDNRPDQVDDRVLGIEAGRLIAIGEGATEIICVPEDDRAYEVDVRRLGIEPDCRIRVFDFPRVVVLPPPVLAAEDVSKLYNGMSRLTEK